MLTIKKWLLQSFNNKVNIDESVQCKKKDKIWYRWDFINVHAAMKNNITAYL